MSATGPSLPVGMGKRVHAVSTQLAAVRSTLAPLLKLPMKEAIARLGALEKARLEVALSFAINALYFVYLKTRGENPADHPVKKELDTVKAYLKKLKATQQKVDMRAAQRNKKEAEIGANAAIAFDKAESEGTNQKKRGAAAGSITTDRSGGKPTRAQVNTAVIQRTVNRIISSKKRRNEDDSQGSQPSKEKNKNKKRRQVKTATRKD